MIEKDEIRVLIVDDEERFRSTTTTLLKKRGFAVTGVGSGTEALDRVRESDLDVVVLDIRMPGMDGNEALREIKKLRPHVEVIMLTGHGTAESALDGLKQGAFDYLAKPCDIDILAKKIKAAYAKEKGVSAEEPRVRDVMVPLSSFSTIGKDKTVKEAVEKILLSFREIAATTKVRETLHRSTLIMDEKDNVIGVLSFTDLLEGMQPPYMRLLKERPMLADNIRVEPFNYKGMFTIMSRDLAKKTVEDLMSEAPPHIDGGANLMEAANTLLAHKVRRLLVTEGGKTVGVVREQDLFFEIARLVEAEPRR
jgi:DNA-binding response OmpR family regulator